MQSPFGTLKSSKILPFFFPMILACATFSWGALSKTHFRCVLGPLWGVSLASWASHDTLLEAPGAMLAPKKPPRSPKRPPRDPKRLSKGPQGASKRPREAPQRPPRGHHEAFQRPQRSSQECPKEPTCTISLFWMVCECQSRYATGLPCLAAATCCC